LILTIYQWIDLHNQFLYSKDFVSGSLEVNQQTYFDKQINYDIYKQKLLLSFQDQNQANRIIEIPLIHLESFSMENKYFKLIAWDDSTRRIFQQIGENDIQILIYWFKELNAISSTDNYNYQFTDAKKQIWILKEGDFHQVTNNKNFHKLFPAEKQTELKKWMKSQRIKIQKSGDINLDLLIKYCENL